MPKTFAVEYDPWSPVEVTDIFSHNDNEQAAQITGRRSVSLYTEDGELRTPPRNIVSSSYPLIPNSQGRDIAYQVMDNAGLEYEESKVLFNGSKFRLDFNILNHDIEPVPGDKLGLRCTIVNSYDGSTKFGVMFNAWRQICTNGMEISHLLGGFKFKHANGDRLYDEIETATENLRLRAGNLEALGNHVVRLKNEPIGFLNAQQVAKDLKLSDSFYGGAMLEIEEANMWGLYNAFTYLLSQEPNFANHAMNKRISEYFFRN